MIYTTSNIAKLTIYTFWVRKKNVFTKRMLAETFDESEVCLPRIESDNRPEDRNSVRTMTEVDRFENFAAASEDREAWSPRIRSWTSFGIGGLNHWGPGQKGDPETKEREHI